MQGGCQFNVGRAALNRTLPALPAHRCIKAHARWLEAKLVREIKKAKRAEVFNGNEPGGSKLPEPDTGDMETFFENIRLLLPTLGINVFATETVGKSDLPMKDAVRLELKWDDARAECLVIDGQFVVQAGSIARAKEVDSLRSGTRALRKQLLDSGALAPAAGKPSQLEFTMDYAFDSPSAASTLLAAAESNGRVAWKVKGTGESYKDWLEKQVTAASDDRDTGSA